MSTGALTQDEPQLRYQRSVAPVIEEAIVQMDRESRSGGTPSRIVVADDHPLMREALTRTLDEQPDLEAIGEAADGPGAVKLCRRSQPELVLMDVMMPGMDGLEATRQIKEELPRTIVLVLTAIEDPILLSEALKAGAAGYVLKRATTTEILGAVRKVLDGESPLDQQIATRLLLQLMEEERQEQNGIPKIEARPGLLSPRETEVLRLVAGGYTNQQIARDLLISVSTVKKHVRNVISKLGASDRTQAAVRAIELGLLAERGEGQSC
jgi:NarL family two-component system response regulator LiaR